MSDEGLYTKPCDECGAPVGEPCRPRYIGDTHTERSAFGCIWGHTPIGWLIVVCPCCGTDLECHDPDAKPLLDDPYCRRCTTRARCTFCDGPGTRNCPCRGTGLKPEGAI